MKIESRIGYSTRDEIFVRGRSLVRDLMGVVDFTDMCLLEITGEMPSERVKKMTNALLVLLSDHGLTPSVIAARMTLLGAPESVQGAVAAGLLGAGNHFLGTAQNAAEMLQAVTRSKTDWSHDELRAAAEQVVRDHAEKRAIIPGLGHPIHKEGDPRSMRLFELAAELGFRGANVELLSLIQERVCDQRKKFIPLNAAGAVGAVVSDMGWSPFMARALALIARTPGILAHLAEEIEDPQGAKMWDLVIENSDAFHLDAV